MKKLIMLLALAGFALTIHVGIGAHNGYRHKTTRAQKRRHAYRVLTHSRQLKTDYSSPLSGAAIDSVHGSGTSVHGKFSIKKTILVLLLLCAQPMCLHAADQELMAHAIQRVGSMWPAIADRMGLPENFLVLLSGYNRCDFGYEHADLEVMDKLGFDEYAEQSVHEDPWCPKASIEIAIDRAVQSTDDALAWTIGHEMTHAKYDCNKLSMVLFALVDQELAVFELQGECLFSRPLLRSEVEIIEEFELQTYLAPFPPGVTLEIVQLHLKKAMALGLAIRRLGEFRADRIGCEVAMIPDCASTVKELYSGFTEENDCDTNHPTDKERVAALDEMSKQGVVSEALDISGRYSDEEILSIAEQALRIKQQCLKMLRMLQETSE